MGGTLGAILFIALVAFMIMFHEFGHYITARWSGIKILKFFLGFGPTLWSVRRGRAETVIGPDGEPTVRPETEYGIKLLPLGGFVKPLGFSPYEEIPPEDYDRSFRAASAPRRALVLVAGSATHLITTIILLVVVFSLLGVPDPDRATLRIDTLYEEVAGQPAPALNAGLRPGDTVVAVNGEPARSWEHVRDIIRGSPGTPISLTIDKARGGQQTVNMTPVTENQRGQSIGVIGVLPVFERTRLKPLAGIARSGVEMGRMVSMSVKIAPRAFSLRNLGVVPGRAPTNERPVSIYGAGRVAAGLAERGDMATFLYFFAQINLFVAIFNMLPVPPLDGGWLLLLGIEKLRRGRPLNYRVVYPITAVAFGLLLFLGLSVLLQDIFRPLDPFQ